MLIGLLLAGNLAGFGGGAAGPAAGPSGGAHKHKRSEAVALWEQQEARKRWQPEIEAWLRDEPYKAPDAPKDSAPRLTKLVARTTNTPEGDALVQALARENTEQIALAAYLAEREHQRREDEAISLLLLLN